MFPELNLTNDQERVYIRPLPLLDDYEQGEFRFPCYHLDARFEAAFTQPWLLAEALVKAVVSGRRVIIEHFELLCPLLGLEAEVLIGIGEEIVINRPTILGPKPEEMARSAAASLKYRLMAHSAEDLTTIILAEMGNIKPAAHRAVKHGFVLEFPEKPALDCAVLEEKVKELIQADLPIAFRDEEHICLGDKTYHCSGPNLHIRRTGQISGFFLHKEWRCDPLHRLYDLVGVVGEEKELPF
jgi:hypothetical protein